MPSRRPRLPMFLGLAVLTAMANFLLLALHALLHVGLGIAITPYGALMLALVSMGPIVGVALMLQGRPRHGAAVFSILMALSTFTGLFTHYADDNPDNTFYAQMDVWGQLFSGTSFMQVAFGIQGLSGGVVLLLKPEAPRPRNSEMQAS